MIEIICLFFPTVISLEYLKRKGKSIRDLFFAYFKYCIVINLIMFIVIKILNNSNDIMFTILFSIKYLILSTILAIILPRLFNHVNENIDIKIIKRIKFDEKRY